MDLLAHFSQNTGFVAKLDRMAMNLPRHHHEIHGGIEGLRHHLCISHGEHRDEGTSQHELEETHEDEHDVIGANHSGSYNCPEWEHSEEDTPGEWDNEGALDIGEIHRGIGVHLPEDLHRFVHDRRRSRAARAQALLDHVRNDHPDSEDGDLGKHWTTEPRVAEDFAEDRADYLANHEATHPRGATAVVFHAHPPAREDIDDHATDDFSVYHHDEHGEREVPLLSGSSADVKGISWMRRHGDDRDDDTEYEHHDFGNHEPHTAAAEPEEPSYRLWRGEGSHSKKPLSEETKGRWFTSDRLTADGYARSNKGHLYYLDVAAHEVPQTSGLAILASPEVAARKEHSPECPGCKTDIKPCPNCGTKLNGSQPICPCGTRIPRFGDPEASEHTAAARPGRHEEHCDCCKGTGTHKDGSQCTRCEGSGAVPRGTRDPNCPDQPAPKRRHWREAKVSSWYHGTNDELDPGAEIRPAAEIGRETRGGPGDENHAWISNDPVRAGAYGAYIYEVVPHDKPKHTRGPNDEHQTSGATVVRQVPHEEARELSPSWQEGVRAYERQRRLQAEDAQNVTASAEDGGMDERTAASVEEYGAGHRPPSRGGPLHDVHNIPDVYNDAERHTWGEPQDRTQALHQFRQARGNPEYPATIYRAMPLKAAGEFNVGDWVSTSRGYAQNHADGRNEHDPESLFTDPLPEHERYHVYEATVPAKHVRNGGNDLMEWGYWGPKIRGGHSAGCCRGEEPSSHLKSGAAVAKETSAAAAELLDHFEERVAALPKAGMAWVNEDRDGKHYTPVSVRHAGFAGLVGDQDWEDEQRAEREERGSGLDEDLWDEVRPEPTKEEEAHNEEHGEYPDSYHERHDQAYNEAEDRKAMEHEHEDQLDHDDPDLFRFQSNHGSNSALWKKHGTFGPVSLRQPIYATQSHVAKEHIQRFLGNPAETSWHEQTYGQVPRRDYLGDKHPLFVTHEGRVHAMEGHHRIAAGFARNEESIPGWHFNLDEHPHLAGMDEEEWKEHEEGHHEASLEPAQELLGHFEAAEGGDMLDLYHHTTEENAAAIMRERKMKSEEHGPDGRLSAFFTTHPSPAESQAGGRGSATVHVRVPAHLTWVEDEFPSGEEWHGIPLDDLRPEHFVDPKVGRREAAFEYPLAPGHLGEQGYRITDESRGWSPSQSWYTLHMRHPGGESHGHIDIGQVGSYDDPHREIHVEDLQTGEGHAGKGIASALMDHVYQENPEPATIHHSLRTDEGGGWWGRYTSSRPHVLERQERQLAAQDEEDNRQWWEHEAAAKSSLPQQFPPPPGDDWEEHFRKLRRKKNPEIHRGMAIELPQEVHDYVMERFQTPDRQAQAIVDHLKSQPLGMHWTPKLDTARTFSEFESKKQPGTIKVIVHAKLPEIEHIETDPERLREGAVFRHDSWMNGEKEIPLKAGAPVHVTGVTWYGYRNRKTRGNVWGEQHIAVRADEPEQHTAAEDTSYRMQHQGPDAEDGEGLHEIGTGKTWPKDFHERSWEYRLDADEDSMDKVHKSRGWPSRKVWVYRALPSPHREVNPGDWVSTSAKYARSEGRTSTNRDDDYPVVKFQARAEHLRNEGNSLDEWSYHGPRVNRAEIHYSGGKNHRGKSGRGKTDSLCSEHEPDEMYKGYEQQNRERRERRKAEREAREGGSPAGEHTAVLLEHFEVEATLHGENELPPDPGTAPIPEGHIRLWHYTPLENVPSIREHGLQRRFARSDVGNGDLSEPSAGMWASTKRPDDILSNHSGGFGVVEYHAHPDEISGNAESPWQAMRKDRTWDNDAVQEWAKGYHHVIMHGDVHPHNIVAIHEPWHGSARYMRDDPDGPESYQWVRDDYAKGPHNSHLEPYVRGLDALERQRRTAALKKIAELANPLTGGSEWFHGSRAPRADLAKGFHDPAADDPEAYDMPDSEGSGSWSRILGNHFAAGHDVARAFASGEHSSPHNDWNDHSEPSIVHARLQLHNPKRYASEFDLDSDAYEHAWKAGNHPGNHMEGGAEENFEAWPSAHSLHTLWGDRQIPEGSTMSGHYTGRPDRSVWLDTHPDRHEIAMSFKQHLMDQGHDGIVYGNEIEHSREDHPHASTSAIAFHPHQIEVTRHHNADSAEPEPELNGHLAVLEAPMKREAARILDQQPPDHPNCDGAKTVWLSEAGEPRCTGCGHRVINPETGHVPVQTRELGPKAWVTEMPNRERAKRATAALAEPYEIRFDQDFHGRHRVSAWPAGYDGDTEYGQPMGTLHWHPEDGHITYLRVEDGHRRKGIATALWNRAHQESSARGLAAPAHSESRTPAASGWAQAVGGHIPPLGKESQDRDWASEGEEYQFRPRTAALEGAMQHEAAGDESRQFFHGTSGTYSFQPGDLLTPENSRCAHVYYTSHLPTAAGYATYGHPLNERGRQDLDAEARPGHVYAVQPETRNGKRIGRHAEDPMSGVPGNLQAYRTKGRLRVLHEVDRETGEPLGEAEHTAALEVTAMEDEHPVGLDVVAHFHTAAPLHLQQKMFDMPHDRSAIPPESGRHNPDDPQAHLRWRAEHDEDYQPDTCEHCGHDLNLRDEHAEKHQDWLHSQDWHTDWNEDDLPDTLHRGIGVHLPEEVHNVVHDESRPVHERASALAAHVLGGSGLGNFWSADPDVSKTYAESARRRYSSHNGPSTPVMFHIHTPEMEHIETDPDQLQHWGVYSYHLAGNREVPLQHQAPLRIKGISWAPPEHEAGGPSPHDPAWHDPGPHRFDQDPAWTHHEFSGEGIRANASLSVPESLEVLAHFAPGQYIAPPQTGEEMWRHLQEAHGARQPADSAKTPGANFTTMLHDQFHSNQTADRRLIQHQHEDPGGHADAGPSRDDSSSRFFTPIPAEDLEERRRAYEPKPERLDDREYSIKDVSRHYDWEGFDPYEIEHLVHHPEHATFTREDVPVHSLRYDSGDGNLQPVHTYSGIAGQGEDEQERLHELERGYAQGARIPPIVVVRHGEHHIIADGSHRAAIHAEHGHTHIPAFVTQRTIFPEQHTAAIEETAAVEATGGRIDPLDVGQHMVNSGELHPDDAQELQDVIDHIRRKAPQSEPINQRDATMMARSMHGRDRMEQAGFPISEHSQKSKYPRGFSIDLPHNHTLGLVPEEHEEGRSWFARIDHREYPMAPRLQYTIRAEDHELPGAVHKFLADPRIEGDMTHQREEGRKVHDEIRRENEGLYGHEAAAISAPAPTGEHEVIQHFASADDDEREWEEFDNRKLPPIEPGQKVFHGTRSILHRGEMLTPGEATRHEAHPPAPGEDDGPWVHVTTRGDEAHNWAKTADDFTTHDRMTEMGRGRELNHDRGENYGHVYPPRVYEVEPTGPAEMDPNKEGMSYRTKHPVRVVREVHPLQCYAEEHENEEHWPDHPHYDFLAREKEEDEPEEDGGDEDEGWGEHEGALETTATADRDAGLPYMEPAREGEMLDHLTHLHGVDPQTFDLHLSPQNQVRWHNSEHQYKTNMTHQHKQPQGVPGENHWPDVFQLSEHTDFAGGTPGGPYRKFTDILADPERHAPFQPLMSSESGLEPREAAEEPRSLTWDEVGERHPALYGTEEVHGEEAEHSDGEGIGSAAAHLAFSRAEDPEAEGHSVHELEFHPRTVDTSRIDYMRHEPWDPRVKKASEGFKDWRQRDRVPPLILVHRHGVFQVADGHHRAAGAEAAHWPSVKAYVAYSPHEDEPFGDGERGPYHGASTKDRPVPLEYPSGKRRRISYEGFPHTADVGMPHRTAVIEPGRPAVKVRYKTMGANGYEDREEEVEGPFYHGGRARLKPGGLLRAGMPTNSWGDEGPVSTHIHFSTSRGSSADYARETNGHLYEVEPTGEAKSGYGPDEFKSVHPLRVIRKIPREEWDAPDEHRTAKMVLDSTACDTVLDTPLASARETVRKIASWSPQDPGEAAQVLEDLPRFFRAADAALEALAARLDESPLEEEIPRLIRSMAVACQMAAQDADDILARFRGAAAEGVWEDPKD